MLFENLRSRRYSLIDRLFVIFFMQMITYCCLRGYIVITASDLHTTTTLARFLVTGHQKPHQTANFVIIVLKLVSDIKVRV